jgi:hypothetical protein
VGVDRRLVPGAGRGEITAQVGQELHIDPNAEILHVGEDRHDGEFDLPQE